MTDTDLDSRHTLAAEAAAEPVSNPARTDMTVAEVRLWLRNWVSQATGRSPDAIDEVTPMVELGLSSRDAVAMAADIEDRTGVTVSIAAAFEHPTIESLATWIVEGDPELDSGDDDTDWTRSGPIERVDIAVVGLATRLPGDMNSPEETWQALLEGRDAITDLPEGRWSEFMDEPRIAERIAKARTRGGYLKDIKGFDSEFFALSKTEADNIDPQQRMALELTWEALEHARIPASSLRGEAVGVFVGTSVRRLQLPGDVRPDRRPPLRDHRDSEFDCRQPGFVLLRLPRPVGRGGHRLLELAGRDPPGACRRCAAANATWPSPVVSTR